MKKPYLLKRFDPEETNKDLEAVGLLDFNELFEHDNIRFPLTHTWACPRMDNVVHSGTGPGMSSSHSQAGSGAGNRKEAGRVGKIKDRASYKTVEKMSKRLTDVLGSEKASEVRLRGSSFPPEGDWCFPQFVECL